MVQGVEGKILRSNLEEVFKFGSRVFGNKVGSQPVSVHVLVSAAVGMKESLLFIDAMLSLLRLCELAAVFLPPRELR